MKSIITKTLITTFIFFIIISFLLLNNQQDKNEDIPKNQDDIIKKQKLYLFIYDLIAILFLFIFIFFIVYNGFLKGCIKTIFIWAFFISCTPIPEAGLLVSLPLKKYLNISLHISQAIVSFIALMILIYFYFYEKKTINSYLIGKLFLGLIKYKYFSIIIISIISSIFTSEFIDNLIDNYINNEKINNTQFKLFMIACFVLFYSLILNSLINKINTK